MKVLYIALGGKGGSDKALVDLLSILSTQHNIKALVVCGRKELTKELAKLDVPTIVYDFSWALCPPKKSLKEKVLYLPRRIKLFFKRRIDLANILEISNRFSPDIISTNVGVVDLGYKLSRITGIPHVWYIREYQLLDHNMHYLGGIKKFKKSLKNNKFNIAITKSLYQYFELRQPSIQIYDGVRKQRTHAPQMEPQKYFIFAGFLFEGKGVDELIRAYKLYSELGGSYELFILGRYDEKKTFHRWIRHFIEENKLDSIKLLGFRDDVDELMAKSAAVIIPSRYEAFGRVTCEAMYNKTLVIGKDTGGTKEQLDNLDEYAGKKISIRYLTEKQLVNQMFHVENISKESRLEFTEKAFELVNKLYSNEASANQVHDYYKTVLNLYQK